MKKFQNLFWKYMAQFLGKILNFKDDLKAKNSKKEFGGSVVLLSQE